MVAYEVWSVGGWVRTAGAVAVEAVFREVDAGAVEATGEFWLVDSSGEGRGGVGGKWKVGRQYTYPQRLHFTVTMTSS
jgi:hypothetical protein